MGWGDHLIDPKVLLWHTHRCCTNSNFERAADVDQCQDESCTNEKKKTLFFE